MAKLSLGARLLGAIALAAASAAAQSASLTMDIPGCAGVALTGTGPSYTVSCTQLVQSCIVNATPASPQGNTQVQLSAACSNPNAENVTWQASRDCNVPTPASPLTATVMETGGRSCVYTATSTTGASAAATVVWQGPGTLPPANAPTGCTATATLASGAPIPVGGLAATGGSIVLNGNCTGGDPVTTWTWRKAWPGVAQSSWATVKSPPDTLPANTAAAGIVYTYGLTACSGPGACAAEVTRTVTVAGTTGSGGTACNGYTNVVEGTMSQLGTLASTSVGGLMGDGVLVVTFQLPNGANPALNYKFVVSEFQGSPATRHITVSTQKCDFTGNGPIAQGAGQTAEAFFGGPAGGTPQLQAGVPYYLNVRNWNFGTGTYSCPAGNACDVLVSYQQR